MEVQSAQKDLHQGHIETQHMYCMIDENNNDMTELPTIVNTFQCLFSDQQHGLSAVFF